MLRFDRRQLFDMLTYARPAYSSTERAFIDRFIRPLPGAYIDGGHNWHVQVGDSPILWSCHTDTVHRLQGYQTLHLEGSIIHLSKRSRKRGFDCLGADDTAGVALCVQMIRANVPGHYIFHSAEEIGGIGSTWIAKETPDLLQRFTYAIALDRRGTGDVITHQYGRCCSDAFANSLADVLNTGTPLAYAPDDSGIFTDTANYTDLIGECTNLSVGYENAHTNRECLDVDHVERLFHALCALSPDSLVSSRQPGDDDPDWHTYVWQDWRDYDDLTLPQICASHDLPEFVECRYCGTCYDYETSNARSFMDYCSRDCEDCCEHRSSVYLDPEHEHVQAALRRQTGLRLVH